MGEVRVRAEKHIEAEESNAGKRGKEAGRLAPTVEQEEPQCAWPQNRDRRDRGNKSKNRSARPWAEERYTPLYTRLPDILDKSLQDGSIRRPTPFVGTMGRNLDSYCRNHKTDDHTTDDRWNLKQQIKQLIQRGALKKYVKEGETGDGKRRKGSTSRRQESTGGKNQDSAQEETEHETVDKGGIN